MTLTAVVICRNVVDQLPDCLGSIHRNTGPGIDFVFVDDWSTDGSRELLEAAVPRIPNARLITHTEPRGASAARNSGIEVATGTYTTFLDGDDWLAPGYYPRLDTTCARMATDFVRVDHMRVYGRKRTLHRAPAGRRGVALPSIDGIGSEQRETMVDYPNVWSGAFRTALRDRDRLLYFDTELRTCEDRLWTWRLHLRTETYAVADLAGLFYRRGVSGSLTAVGDDRQLDFLPALRRVIDEAGAHPKADTLQRKAVRTLLGITHFQLENTERLLKPVARALRTRYRDLAATLPQDLLRSVLDGMDGKRRDALLKLYRPKATIRKGR